MKFKILILLLTISPQLAFAASGKESQLVHMFISWAPFIVLIGLWAYFMRRSGVSKQNEYIGRGIEHMERVEAILEKISYQLESCEVKRNESK
jgi:ATP-dependent Zn protease